MVVPAVIVRIYKKCFDFQPTGKNPFDDEKPEEKPDEKEFEDSDEKEEEV